MFTYREFSETEVANLHILVVVDENVVTLDVSVYNALAVHVKVHHSNIMRYF